MKAFERTETGLKLFASDMHSEPVEYLLDVVRRNGHITDPDGREMYKRIYKALKSYSP